MSTGSPPFVPLLDLDAQRRRLGGRIEAAIGRVLAHGRFVLGPEVEQLEGELARYVGVRHAIGCASGTDALLLVLMAWGVGPGDAVFVPSFTFAATAGAVALAGATPVFVDVERRSFGLDPESLAAALAGVRKAGGLRPRAVIPVDLFGQPADYDALLPIAREHGVLVLQDAAQSFGARLGGVPAGRQGEAAATSFYPSKPLGAYGDGGAVLTDDDRLGEAVRELRHHGQPSGAPGEHRRIGLNGRLDSLQAAVLLEKLAVLDEERDAREAVARRYAEGLRELVRTPFVRPGVCSAWAQYTVLAERRDALIEALAAARIASAVHYRTPLHRQPAYRAFPRTPDGLPVSEMLTGRVLSLPMHADLGASDQMRVIAAIADFFGKERA